MFSLSKGTFPFFLYQKEKIGEKRSWQTCRLIAVSSVVRSHENSTQKPAPGRRTVCLPKPPESFGRFPVLRRTLSEQDELFFWCDEGTATPPKAYFIPTECGEIALAQFDQSPLGAK